MTQVRLNKEENQQQFEAQTPLQKTHRQHTCLRCLITVQRSSSSTLRPSQMLKLLILSLKLSSSRFAEKIHFSRLYPRSPTTGPGLMDEGWNEDGMVNQELCFHSLALTSHGCSTVMPVIIFPKEHFEVWNLFMNYISAHFSVLKFKSGTQQRNDGGAQTSWRVTYRDIFYEPQRTCQSSEHNLQANMPCAYLDFILMKQLLSKWTSWCVPEGMKIAP